MPVAITVTNPDGKVASLVNGYAYVPSPPPPPPPPGPPGAHPYFDSLVIRSDHYKSYSLRNSAQIARYRGGSAVYADYVYATDPDPRRQDAMKLTVPEFIGSGTMLTTPIASTDTFVPVTGQLNMSAGLNYQIDLEVMKFQAPAVGGMTVTRGSLGTMPAPHVGGVPIRIGTNNLQSQLHTPMGTQDGHAYFHTFDVWFGSEFRFANAGIPNYKTFNHYAPGFLGGRNKITLELNNVWDAAPQDAGLFKGRLYLSGSDVGPGVTSEPFGPKQAEFIIKTETWTRYFEVFDQRKSDPAWTLYSLWVADATRGPILIFDRLKITIFGSIASFNWEFNTSHDPIKQGRGLLTAYGRNSVLLRDFAALPPMPRP